MRPSPHALLPVPLLLFVGGCWQPRTVSEIRGRAMGTIYSIKFVLPEGQDHGLIQAKIQDEFDRFDEVFSTYDPKSEISRFNAHASEQPFVASAEFAGVVARALDLAKKTGGSFDPTIAPMYRLYGLGPGGTSKSKVPTPDEIKAMRAFCGFEKLTVSGRELTKRHPQLELDLNAIAKGTGVDSVTAVLDGLDCTSYMVEVGGEVRCRGRKPTGDAWRLGIADPARPTGLIDRVDLVDQAMATSGSTLQFKEFGKTKVHHILDRRTGTNAENKLLSVTVIAQTCELADALATALMVLGPEAGSNTLRAFGGDVKVLYLLAGEDGIEKRSYRWNWK